MPLSYEIVGPAFLTAPPFLETFLPLNSYLCLECEFGRRLDTCLWG